MFDLCGVRNVHRRTFSVVITSTPEQRAEWLQEAAKPPPALSRRVSVAPRVRSARISHFGFGERLLLPVSPHISRSARNADSPERRLAVGFAVAITLKAD